MMSLMFVKCRTLFGTPLMYGFYSVYYYSSIIVLLYRNVDEEKSLCVNTALIIDCSRGVILCVVL